MKKTLVVFVVLALPGAARAAAEEASPWMFHSELDTYLAIKAGAEDSVTDAFGIRAAVGMCVISPSQISYTLVGLSHFLRPVSLDEAVLDIELHVMPDVAIENSWRKP